MALSARLAALCALASLAGAGAQTDGTIQNPNIDMPAYLAVANEAAAHRVGRRLTEEQFLAMSRKPGVVVLDARSRDKYEELHVRGAVNLPFPDITVESLARLLPDPETRILIYCNNNFTGAEGPFPTKRFDAALNLSTYIALYSYGYRDLWELGPLVDLAASKLEFDGRTVRKTATGRETPAKTGSARR